MNSDLAHSCGCCCRSHSRFLFEDCTPTSDDLVARSNSFAAKVCLTQMSKAHLFGNALQLWDKALRLFVHQMRTANPPVR